MSPTQYITVACASCGKPASRARCFLGEKEIFTDIPVECDPCEAIRDGAKKPPAQLTPDEFFDIIYGRRIPWDLQRATTAEIAPAYAACTGWKYDHHPGGLFLTGTNGSGKSMAMAAAIRSARRSFRWVTAAALREQIACSMASDDHTERREAAANISTYRETSLLAIDDMAACKFTPSFAEQLNTLLDYRFNKRLPVFWTSYLHPGQLGAHIAKDSEPGMARSIERRLCQHSLPLSLP